MSGVPNWAQLAIKVALNLTHVALDLAHPFVNKSTLACSRATTSLSRVSHSFFIRTISADITLAIQLRVKGGLTTAPASGLQLKLRLVRRPKDKNEGSIRHVGHEE